MVKTPGEQTNLGGLENNVSRGVCLKEAIRGGEREGEQKYFGGSALFGVAPVRNEQPEQKETPKMSHQMLDSLEGYLDNITAAATQTAANGTPLAELATSLAVLVDTVARQQLEIKRLTEHINALRKK